MQNEMKYVISFRFLFISYTVYLLSNKSSFADILNAKVTIKSINIAEYRIFILLKSVIYLEKFVARSLLTTTIIAGVSLLLL